MSIQARIKELATDPAPDMVLPEPMYARDYDDAKYIFNRAVETAARDAGVFSGLYYWITYKGTPTSALEVRASLKGANDLLNRWGSRAVVDRVAQAIRNASVSHSTGAVKTPEEAKAALEAVRDFLTRWHPLAEKMIAAKDRAIKGRKPSATPRKTPPRTTENTGTCACCGVNVKLANGKIVMHGYTIRPGWRVGRCFGVGYSPIETGKDGLEAYLLALKSRVSDLERSIASETRPPDTALERTQYQPYRTVGARLENLRSELRFTKSDITSTERRIAEWKPRPLPT